MNVKAAKKTVRERKRCG